MAPQRLDPETVLKQARSANSPIHSILDVILVYSPTQRWRENRSSQRNRYSMACPLPGHNDTEHQDGSGSFSVDATGTFFFCFGDATQKATQPNCPKP